MYLFWQPPTSPLYTHYLYVLLSVVLERVINLNISFRNLVDSWRRRRHLFSILFLSYCFYDDIQVFWKVKQSYEWKWDEDNLHFQRVAFWGLWILGIYILSFFFFLFFVRKKLKETKRTTRFYSFFDYLVACGNWKALCYVVWFHLWSHCARW